MRVLASDAPARAPDRRRHVDSLATQGPPLGVRSVGVWGNGGRVASSGERRARTGPRSAPSRGFAGDARATTGGPQRRGLGQRRTCCEFWRATRPHGPQIGAVTWIRWRRKGHHWGSAASGSGATEDVLRVLASDAPARAPDRRRHVDSLATQGPPLGVRSVGVWGNGGRVASSGERRARTGPRSAPSRGFAGDARATTGGPQRRGLGQRRTCCEFWRATRPHGPQIGAVTWIRWRRKGHHWGSAASGSGATEDVLRVLASDAPARAPDLKKSGLLDPRS